MNLSFVKTYCVLSFLFLVACQSVTEQQLNAKSPFDKPDNKYSNVKLEFSDTTSPEARRIISSLDSFYRVQVRGGFNGSVLVGYKGKVLYERYFGYCNKEGKVAMCAESSSQLASTSKTFTATAVLWLHQNKYLDINLPVKTYIKSFPYSDITVKMLMEHRSGLPDYLKFSGAYWKNNVIKTNDDLLELFAQKKPRLNSRIDSRFEYSNSNYAVLASVLEKVTKMPYPKFMKEFIFEPLGMNHSFIYDPHAVKPEKMAISYKYNWVREPDTYADGIYGDKGIYSTVEDLYRWDQSFYNYILLNKESQKMAYTGYSNEKPGIKNYGLGWRMMDYPSGYKVVYHNGWWHGNNTVFYRFIRDNFTIIVLGNKYNTKIYSQAKAVYNIVQSNSNEAMEWEESGSPSE